MHMGKQGSTEVYVGEHEKQGCTGVYMGEHENTGVYRSIHE